MAAAQGDQSMSTETRAIRREMTVAASVRAIAVSAAALYGLGCTLITVMHIATL